MTARGSGDAGVFASWPEAQDPAGGHVCFCLKLRWLSECFGLATMLLEISVFFLEIESMALDLGCVQNPITRFSYISGILISLKLWILCCEFPGHR